MRRAWIALLLAPLACDDGLGEPDGGIRRGEIVFEPDLPPEDEDEDVGDTGGGGEEPGMVPGFGVAPTCRIVTPSEGSTFGVGAPIRFSADVFDPDGDISTVLWTSNVWGAIVTGLTFDRELPADRHEVTLRVTDEAGHICIDRIVIVVIP